MGGLILPTDVELVEAAAFTYGSSSPYFQDDDHAVRVFLTERPDGLKIIAIEGTHDPLGWMFDFLGVSTDDQQGMNHETLGFIHAGFYDAALPALARCALIAAQGPYAICGHSLGAALALLIGGILSQYEFNGRGLPPVKIGAFAPPKVGGSTFVKTVTAFPFCAYRYGGDVVPTVPIALPGLPYEQVPLIDLRDAHAPPLGMFGAHHIDNYVAGVTALAAAVTNG